MKPNGMLHNRAVRQVDSRKCPRCGRIQIRLGNKDWRHMSRTAEERCARLRVPRYWWNE